MIPLEKFIYPTQELLFKQLRSRYKNNTLVMKDKFILVKGDAPIMLVAHLDTVHKIPVKFICKSKNNNILMSPQGIGGDDRCGVYALVNCYKDAVKKPWLLFTCDEEIGGVGATAFADAHAIKQLPRKLDDLKLIIEIDRRGKNDAVYYDCDNPKFEDYITSKGFVTNYGSFSDISIIAPELGVAAVNLSSGYYNAHTCHEYINRKQINATIRKVNGIIQEVAEIEFPRFEYVERKYNLSTYSRFLNHASLIEDDYLDYLPKDLPREYVEKYDELLEWYTIEELEHYRHTSGNKGIDELYETEFGGKIHFTEEELK